MSDTLPSKRRIRTERLEVITSPEDQKLDLVQERIRLQKANFINELKARLGLIQLTCEATGISHDTVRNWARTDPEFLAATTNIGEYTLDVVEQKFLSAIVEKGDITAMIFYLKTKGKQRGYSQRVELTGAGGGPIESETTLKIAEIQKELPPDILDSILGSVIANNATPERELQPVAKVIHEIIDLEEEESEEEEFVE